MAGKINVLGFEIANMIAAGEVVDRPASAVKELVENSLDAGAKSITVEIRRGGIGFIRVSDNGTGMDSEDVPLAVLRHATSKISTAEDLAGICTLGFRGEALAAISAVSHLRILTKTADAPMGTLLCCDGGEITEYTETGCAVGTTIIAEELFYNVPARRKFMKKDSTEAAAVTAVMEKLALSSPDVSFKYILDGDVRFMTPGDGDLYGAAYVIFGKEAATRLIRLDRSENGIRVWGFTSEPDYVRSNHNMQYFFINGRYIRSRTITAAVDNAYATRIAKERFPFCILNVEITPGLVDVNVHPSKLEVKFTNERLIYEAVYYAVLDVVTKDNSMPELNIPSSPTITGADTAKTIQKANIPEQKPAQMTQRPLYTRDYSSEPPPISKPKHSTAGRSSWVNTETANELKNPFAAADTAHQIRISEAVKAEEKPAIITAKTEDTPIKEEDPTVLTDNAESQITDTASDEPETTEVESKDDVPEYHIIGEAYNCYVIVELEDRLVIIDKHAAHERIIFDELCRKLREGTTHGQILMFPIREKITSAESEALEEYRESFEKLGFTFECDTARGEVVISAIPEEIGRNAAPDMLISLAGQLAEGIGTIDAAGIEFFEKKLFQASCKAAIKGGRVYRGGEVKYICEKLLCRPEKSVDSAIKTCPHGRPVAFELRKNSIERQFSRLT
ncbi:MAG: DNA mismatch repair endonuclease MutL [Clostridia bacterium]|nr:DNA mismatch repair endonuclease MutL [Clostridia bacterium]